MRKLPEKPPPKPKADDLCDQTNRFLSEPLDLELLRQEVKAAQEKHDYTAKAFKGWSSIPLRSLNGVIGSEGSQARGDHASSDPTLFKDTVVMQPYIKSVVEQIAGNAGVLKVRLMRLRKGHVISEHRDIFRSDGGRQVLRLHIPIVTNKDVIFHVNKQPYHMEEGRLYSMDVSQVHSVFNKGNCDRIHLVFDVCKTPAILKKLKE